MNRVSAKKSNKEHRHILLAAVMAQLELIDGLKKQLGHTPKKTN